MWVTRRLVVSVGLIVAGPSLGAEPDDGFLEQSTELGQVRVRAARPVAGDAVRIAVTPAQEAGIASLCLVFDATWCEATIPFSPMLDLKVPSWDGAYELAIFLKGSGGPPQMLVFPVLVDRAPPRPVEVTAERTPQGVRVAWRLSEVGPHDGDVRSTLIVGEGTPSCGDAEAAAWTGTAREALLTTLPDDVPLGLVACATDAAGNTGASGVVSVAPADREPPTITGVALAGKVSFASGREVALAITATDASPITRWCATSRTEPACAWQPFAPRVLAPVPVDRPEAVVYVRVADAWGNESAPFEVVLPVDVTPPVATGVAVDAGPEGLTATWETLEDPHQPRVVLRGGPEDVACGGGTLLAQAPSAPLAVSPDALRPHAAWVACAVDAGGATAELARGVLDPAWFPAPPDWDDAVLTLPETSTRATLPVRIEGHTSGPPAEVCVQTSPGPCDAWQRWPKSGVLQADLGDASGDLTVQVAARWDAERRVDLVGQVLVDTTSPTTGRLRAKAAGEVLRVTWSGFEDEGSGIDRYLLAGRINAAPPDCDDPSALLYDGPATSAEVPLTGEPATWLLVLCAVDRAGGLSAPAGATVRVR